MFVAVAIVAVMLAVPLSIPVNADAAFTEEEAGYCTTMDNPTASELASMGTSEKNELLGAVESLLRYFNGARYGDTSGVTTSKDSLYKEVSGGESVSSDSVTMLSTEKLEIKNVKITMPVVSAGDLMVTDTSELNEKEIAAVNAIKEYLGATVAVGDKVIITGDVSTSMATKMVVKYAMVGESNCTHEKTTMKINVITDTSLTIELIKSGDESGKTVKIVSNAKGYTETTTTYEYDKDYSELTGGEAGKMVYDVTNDFTYDYHFAVDGENYDLYEASKTPEPVPCTAVIVPQSSIKVDPALKAEIASLPDSSGNIKVGKEYSDAESAYSAIEKEAGKKGANLVLIIVGVVVAVVIIGGVAFFVIKKKKA